MTVDSETRERWDREDNGGAVVALSGGQDSGTCLFWAIANYERVEAVSFDYGQRHAIELKRAEQLAHEAGVPWKVLPVEALGELAGGGLTSDEIEISAEAEGTGHDYAAARGLPSSFVPGRNIILLGLAAAYGLPRGLNSLVTGVCAMDRAGYPDCREEFVHLLRQTIAVGMDELSFEIRAPLLTKTKAETWGLAASLGVLETIRHITHTCYHGDSTTWNEWGWGCGACPACEVRAEGWAEYERGRALGKYGNFVTH